VAPPSAAIAAAEPRCRIPLTPTAPLRLWIGGDSLAWSLGTALGKTAAATGVVAPVFDARPSSGLTSPGFFDWPKHASDEMARLNPEIVVFMISTNDWAFPQGTTVTTTSVAATSTEVEPAWKTRYAELVEQMLAVLVVPGRTVYWVGAPTLQDARQEAGAHAASEVAREVVTRHTDVVYVDAHAIFAGPDGRYTASFDGPDGRKVVVRAGDGVHFTPEGGQRLADAVFNSLDQQCKLRTQAVAGSPQVVIETKGSSAAPVNAGQSSTGSVPPATMSPGTTTPPTTPAPTADSAPTTATAPTATTGESPTATTKGG
jgi:hypothetical protein